MFVSPQRSDVEGTVQMDGEGYAAVVQPLRWKSDSSKITFKFRTFSTEALLMYLATKDMVCMSNVNPNNPNVKTLFDNQGKLWFCCFSFFDGFKISKQYELF